MSSDDKIFKKNLEIFFQRQAMRNLFYTDTCSILIFSTHNFTICKNPSQSSVVSYNKQSYTCYMLIQQIVSQSYIHTRHYRLTISYVEKMRKGNVHGGKIKLILDSKDNNLIPQKLTAEVEMDQQQLKPLYLKLASPRLYIQRKNPRITLLEVLSIKLVPTTSTFTQKEIKTVDMAINYGEKYWKELGRWEMEGCIGWPVHINILHKGKEGVRIGEISTLALGAGIKVAHLSEEIKSLGSWEADARRRKQKEAKKIKEYTRSQMEKIFKSRRCKVDWNLSMLKTNSRIFPSIPLSTITIEKQFQHLTQKEKLFRHIFLTQVITHMIINQFGRSKRKQHKYRDGRVNYQYDDENLQALRSCGYRFSEFRDHSVESFHPPEEEDEYSDSSESEEVQGRGDENNAQLKKKKKISEVGRVGKKIKRVLKKKILKTEQIENFILMSGEDKSHLNRKRYCLHQMARETDKTQALINFIQLTFQAYWPAEDLLSTAKDSQETKKKRMNYFLHEFKVKRQAASCLREYTRASFLHRVLNLGLRILREPYELTYLRLPFSHIFWSIRILYQRHKRAIFENKKDKNRGRVIRLYRGCQMSESEIRTFKSNVGGFIQMEGFLSTTLREEVSFLFASNALFIIDIPASSLNGPQDHGFAHMRSYSLYPAEKEVLFNAFNLFKIVNLDIRLRNNIELVEIFLEYGGIKQIEDKVRKSDNLLESEFLMKIQEQKIHNVKHLLSMKEEKMTPEMVENLKEKLGKEEKKLEKWKNTLKKQEEKEFTEAYNNLSSWEQELLDNYDHQEKIMKRIENYGQLMLVLGDYYRGTAYSQRILKQVERDKAIEGWQWRKTICLLEREQFHRFLLSEFYSRQCRYQQSATELEKVKELYEHMNMSTSNSSYIRILVQLRNTYHLIDESGYSEDYTKYRLLLKQISQKHNITNLDEIFDTQDKNDARDKIQVLSAEELDVRIKQQKQKLKKMRIHTEGQYTANYLSQHYMLIYMMYKQQYKKYPWEERQKRTYKGVFEECLNYFTSIRKYPNRLTTIQVFQILLWVIESVENRNIIKGILNITCRKLTQLLTPQIYHQQELHTIQKYIKFCVHNELWMTMKSLYLKMMKTQICCLISNWDYERMMMIFLCGMKLDLGDEYLSWVQSTEAKIKTQHQLYRKKEKMPQKTQFARFPDSLAHMDGTEWFTCIFDGVKWLNYKDVIKVCVKMIELQSRHDHKISRQYQYLQILIRKYIRIYNLQRHGVKASEEELKKVLRVDKFQMMVWQQKCEVWQQRQFAISKFMIKGDIILPMLQPQFSHKYYQRVAFTISQLHLPQEAFDEFSPQDEQPIWKKIRNKHYNNKNQTKWKQWKLLEKLPVLRRLAREPFLQDHEKYQSQKGREVQAQIKKTMELFLMQSQLTHGTTSSLHLTKQYCQHIIGDVGIPVYAVVGHWDQHQLEFVRRQLHTINKLHLKAFPPQPPMMEGTVSSLTMLLRQQIIKEQHQLQEEKYMIAVLKALLQQNSLPRQLLKGVFYSRERCSQLSQLLTETHWKYQLLTIISLHYPNQQLQQILQTQQIRKVSLDRENTVQNAGHSDEESYVSQTSELQTSELQSYRQQSKQQMLTSCLHYDKYGEEENDIEREKKQSLRYSVLRMLLYQQKLNQFVMPMLSPIIYYQSIKKKEKYEYEFEMYYRIMKNAYQALLQALLDAKCYLHPQWPIPIWWDGILNKE